MKFIFSILLGFLNKFGVANVFFLLNSNLILIINRFVYFSQAIYVDIYVKDVLNSREKQKQNFSKCFQPLLLLLSHEEFQTVILPAAIKMLKRNPEIVLESVGFLLANVNIDLSKYALELLPVLLPQARHMDEDRRTGALSIVRCLSEKSSNPDTIEAMFASVKAIIGGWSLYFIDHIFINIRLTGYLEIPKSICESG